MANRPARAFIGTSGWRYREWRGDFYPPGLVQRLELRYLAEQVNSAEINGSFYSLQRPSSYERWRDETPDDFVFAVKGGRFLTHMLALRNTGQAMANFFASGVLALNQKLGPVLWQLPARTVFDADVLDSFLGLLPRTTADALFIARKHDDRMIGRVHLAIDESRRLRHALEIRHDSFVSEAAYEILRRHDVALVIADTAGVFPMPRETTSDFQYVRLHGSRELYASGYTPDELDTWAADVRGWLDLGQDVYVYFDNDIHGYAPWDAVGLAERVP